MESLEKQLICPICLEMFSKPVVILPCQHNLCRKCANDIFQASNPYLSTRGSSTLSSGGRFRCPSCRHEVVLDRHGVYGLQRNLLVENIIDMYKQGTSSKVTLPAIERVEHPTCDQHENEKINIYCVSCAAPTCSLCKVFGAHKDCDVAPLEDVFAKKKAELSECIAMLVGANERIQAVIAQVEQTCIVVDDNGRRQKSKVCESFDHLFAMLEERKSHMSVRINTEQEEKMDYIRGLKRKYNEHLENTIKLVETGIQTMDESEMAVFLQAAKPLLHKIMAGCDISHLDKVQPGYEKMEHLTATFERQRRALMSLGFLKPGEDEDGNKENKAVEVRRSKLGGVSGLAANHQPAPSQSHIVGPLMAPHAPTLQAKVPPTDSQAPPSSTTPIAPTFTQASGDHQNNVDDTDDVNKHVFSFSWLNHK
ncbi:tripartite motif-containing protein 54-like [Entelurus aequoreus]|uniref:tripartite motif-containing protein 54-like n=1 Tax=Entelurus aequoreus TaxID=161455 RepID=UPI002B1D6879|nr:tripartite motif-containing protein 54-like [Entelurus aequoreus]